MHFYVYNCRNIWKRKIRLTNGMHDYKYRYFIARIVESDSEDCETTVDVSKWETNIRQRVFSPRGTYIVYVYAVLCNNVHVLILITMSI